MSDALILKQARWKSFLAFAAALAFVVAGLWMITHPENSSRYPSAYVAVVGWVCILFFFPAGFSAAYAVFKPTQLILTPQGFEVRALRNRPLVKWRAVEGFFITRVKASKFVSYTLKPDASVERGAGGIFGHLKRNKDLPPHLDKRPEIVRDLMETWRLRYTAES